MQIISKDITKAIRLLESEELVAIPTETVYGLAGNIYSEKAIRSIFELKQRPLYNPLIVHIGSPDKLGEVVLEVPDKAHQLAQAFWPGPLTLVLPKNLDIPDLVTAGKNTVAVRIPDHPLTLELLRKLTFPLAAPSANPFGRISSTRAQHVADYFREKLPMVLDGGECRRGIESTIIGFEDGQPILYRLGSISLEEIKEAVGPVLVKNKEEHAPAAPGMLSRHYAPRTRTVLVEDLDGFLASQSLKSIGLLVFSNKVQSPNIAAQKVLSPSGDLQEAAANLYASLHEFDRMDLDLIVCERFPDHGLGRSINDRLQRATKPADN